MNVFKSLPLPLSTPTQPFKLTLPSKSPSDHEVVVLINGSPSTSDGNTPDTGAVINNVTRFDDTTMERGGYLFYKPTTSTSSEYTALHMSDIVLIGLGKGDDDEDRVWCQVSISEEDACELTIEGDGVKGLYELLTQASDETVDEEEEEKGGGTGGGDDSFAAFCKAVEGGATGFIGGEEKGVEGQFDDE